MRALVGIAVGVAVASSLASAKPLPKGLAIKLSEHRIVASRDGVTVPINDNERIDKLVRVELKDDTTLALTSTECMGEEVEWTLPLAKVDARIENVLGMKAHTKHKYADAIAHFTIAAQKDPDEPVYATNLLSAQSMSNRLDDADRTIATYAKRNLAWWAWRFVVDPELNAAHARPAGTLADKRGTAKGSLIGKIAYSPLGLAATEVATQIWDGIPDGSMQYELAIADVATGKELLRLPTETTCAVNMEAAMNGNPNPPPQDKACPKREAAKAAKRRKVTDAVLAELGFAIVANGYVSLYGSDGDVKEAVGPDGRKLVLGDKATTLVVAGKSRPFALHDHSNAVAFVPGAIVVVHRSDSKTFDRCDSADGWNRMELEIVSTR